MKVDQCGIKNLRVNDAGMMMLIRLIESKRRKERTNEIYLPYEKLGWIEEKYETREEDIRQAIKEILDIFYYAKREKVKSYDCIFFLCEEAILWDKKDVTIRLTESYGEMIEMGLSMLNEEGIIDELKQRCEKQRGSLELRYHTRGEKITRDRMVFEG